jgi:hypothetical protein
LEKANEDGGTWTAISSEAEVIGGGSEMLGREMAAREGETASAEVVVDRDIGMGHADIYQSVSPSTDFRWRNESGTISLL